MSKTGKVYLVGAGPGDPGLVTLRAKECIENADVIIYDHLANPETLGWARDDAEITYVGKTPGESRSNQNEINALLIKKAHEGKQVVRLKGGDPFVFGRGAEEAQEIAIAGIPFEIVPGITSAIAGPAYAGIPMTHRAHNSHVTFFTGHEDPTTTESAIDYAALTKPGGTQVMLMGVDHLGIVTSEMLKHGVRGDLPVALVRWATTGQQETLTGTLSDIAQKVAAKNFEAPAVAVFGDVVSLRDTLNWYEKRPLLGKRIVVTRTRKQASVLSNKLRALGAHVIDLPTIRIEPPGKLRAEKARDVLPKELSATGAIVDEAFAYRTVPETRDTSGAQRQLAQGAADLITFTSSSTVENFLALGLPWPKGMRIASIGPITSKTVRDQGLNVDIEARRHDIDGLVQAVRELFAR